MTEEGKLRVLIADDELLARRRITRLLAAMNDVELVAECADGEEVLTALEDEEVDVLLLDVQMPGLNGLDAAGLLGSQGPAVIFTTAHPEHAVAAFDVGAVDYVLKPIEASRLAKALDRARDRCSEAAESVDRLALTVQGEVRLLDPGDITHALFDGALVTVHTDKEALLTDLTLQELQRKLPSDDFERVHRRALLNLSKVDRLQPLPTGGYTAVTVGGAEVPISRQVARELRKRLGLT